MKKTAYLYIRQSMLRQVFENTESTQRQYALRQRAIVLGWPSEHIEVIDCDQGQSGASTAEREGFQKLVTEVSLGKAGIVMGLEVSRLARNCADSLEVSEILDFVCQELASLTRSRDYSLLWANTKPPADLTVNDAEDVCQHFIRRNVSGVFFAPFEFAADKDQVSKRTAEELRRAGIAVVLLDRDLVPFSFRSDFDLIGIDNDTPVSKPDSPSANFGNKSRLNPIIASGLPCAEKSAVFQSENTCG